MTLFKSFVQSSGAITVADADEFVMVDDSASASKRFTWSAFKTALTSHFVSKDTATAQTVVSDVTITKAGTAKLTSQSTGGNALVYADAAAGALAYFILKQATVEKFQLKVTAAGNIEIYGSASGKSATLLSTAGGAAFNSLASFLVPAATVAGSATRISHVDATYGRVTIDDIEVGDTGWRDMSSYLATGLAKSSYRGYAQMRRIGQRVYCDLRLDVSGSTTYIFGSPSAILPGFAPDLNGKTTTFQLHNALIDDAAATPYPESPSGGMYLNATSLRPVSAPPNPGTLVWSGTWLTADAWPSSFGTSTQITAPFVL